MLYRGTGVFLVVILFVAALPFGNTTPAKIKGEPRPQTPGLQLSQTRVDLPDGGKILKLTGQYQVGEKRVNLRALTTMTNRPQYGGPPPIGTPNGSAAEGESWSPETDNYHSNSDMSRSDGTPLVQATYEYEDAANRSMLYITITGVTLTFNFNTEEVGPVTDVDSERLNAWLQSEDGRLVQDTSIAIIEQGSQQAESELLLNYYAVAMLIDSNPPSESTSKNSKGGRSLRTTLARFESTLGASTDATLISPVGRQLIL